LVYTPGTGATAKLKNRRWRMPTAVQKADRNFKTRSGFRRAEMRATSPSSATLRSSAAFRCGGSRESSASLKQEKVNKVPGEFYHEVEQIKRPIQSRNYLALPEIDNGY